MSITVELRDSSNEAFCEGLLEAMRVAIFRCHLCNHPLQIDLQESDFLDKNGHRRDAISKQFPCPSCGQMNARYLSWEVEFGAFVSRSDEGTEASITVCPQCSGKVQVLKGAGAFCLDCDWDDLPPLNAA